MLCKYRPLDRKGGGRGGERTIVWTRATIGLTTDSEYPPPREASYVRVGEGTLVSPREKYIRVSYLGGGINREKMVYFIRSIYDNEQGGEKFERYACFVIQKRSHLVIKPLFSYSMRYCRAE